MHRSRVWKTYIRRWIPKTLQIVRIRRSNRAFGEIELQLIEHLSISDRVSIDVGSNIGSYTFEMIRYCSQVLAFEPVEEHAAHLRSFRLPGVQIFEVALSDRRGKAQMTINVTGEASVGGMGSLETIGQHREGAKTVARIVKTETLDGLVTKPVGLIKIDVEGHEEAVIKGAENTIRQYSPNLLIELEERLNPGCTGRLRSKLDGLGY